MPRSSVWADLPGGLLACLGSIINEFLQSSALSIPDSFIGGNILGIIMQGSRGLEVAGFQRPSTVHCGRPNCPNGSSEDDKLENQSCILPHPAEPLQDQSSTTRIYLECPDYDLSDEGPIASAERSSSTCVSVHRLGSLDGPVEPHILGTSSSSCLTGKQEESNSPPSPAASPFIAALEVGNPLNIDVTRSAGWYFRNVGKV